MKNNNTRLSDEEIYERAVQAIRDYVPKQNQDKDEELIPAEPIEPWVPEGPEMDLDEIYRDENK